MEVYLPRGLKRSQLQERILIYLSRGPEESLTKIAKSIGSLRPSVSRSLHRLEKSGRIWRSEEGYKLTIWGKEEILGIERLELARDVKILWWDTSVGFGCPCGNSEIIIDDESGDKTCDCGRIYRFTATLERVIRGI